MLSQARDPSTDYLSTRGRRDYDADVFTLLWRSTVTALSYIFDHAGYDMTIVETAVTGFCTCAQMAAQLHNVEVFDNVIIALCQRALLTKRAAATPDSPMGAEEVSLGVQFGRSPRAQAAARAVFFLTKEHGDFLKEGWANVVGAIVQMYCHDLLPVSMLQVADFVVGPRDLVPTVKQNVVKADTSIFSALSSFFSDASTPQRTREGDAAALASAKKCIDQCQIPQLFSESAFLEAASLQELVKALIFLSCAREHLSQQVVQCRKRDIRGGKEQERT